MGGNTINEILKKQDEINVMISKLKESESGGSNLIDSPRTGNFSKLSKRNKVSSLARRCKLKRYKTYNEDFGKIKNNIGQLNININIQNVSKNNPNMSKKITVPESKISEEEKQFDGSMYNSKLDDSPTNKK